MAHRYLWPRMEWLKARLLRVSHHFIPHELKVSIHNFGNEFCQVHWQVNISRLSSHPISNYGWNSWSEAELKHRQQPMTYCNVGASVAGLVAEPEIFLCHRRSTLTKSTGYGCSLNEQNRNSQIGSNNCSVILVKTLISTQHDCALKS